MAMEKRKKLVFLNCKAFACFFSRFVFDFKIVITVNNRHLRKKCEKYIMILSMFSKFIKKERKKK